MMRRIIYIKKLPQKASFLAFGVKEITPQSHVYPKYIINLIQIVNLL
jgi:hypothetical protein